MLPIITQEFDSIPNRLLDNCLMSILKKPLDLVGAGESAIC